MTTNNLYLVGVDVARGNNTEMPQPLTGAHVPVLVATTSHELAAEYAVSVLRSQGFEVVELHSPIQQIDPTQWTNFVQANWAEFESNVPDQTAVLEKIATGGMFFGPFAGYARP